ncbi:MAG: hypothetical protein J7604_17655 [Sporocytophaga sp.]|uniref:hypothetical protein n=1 Tax=Sporocytophaga sp. TaxID=2231183 RepID=UPI001B29F150|nr:hypothetical protein [Sporocytophaga sp.]MBO9702038.1 hypothetical protein [Sporocytophaga sp.]
MKATLNKFYFSAFFAVLIFGCSGSNQEKTLKPESMNAGLFPSLISSLTGSNKTLKAGEYIQWIEDKNNGLIDSRDFDDLNYYVQYKPIDYVTLKTLGPDGLNKKIFSETKKEYEGMQYFTLTLSNRSSQEDLLRYDVTGSEEYQHRVSYFAFDAQNDIKLIQGTDTLYCKLYHFERTYNIGPFVSLLMGFDMPSKKNQSSDKILTFHDRAFGNGIIKLKIKSENVEKIPDLIF